MVELAATAGFSFSIVGVPPPSKSRSRPMVLCAASKYSSQVTSGAAKETRPPPLPPLRRRPSEDLPLGMGVRPSPPGGRRMDLVALTGVVGVVLVLAVVLAVEVEEEGVEGAVVVGGFLMWSMARRARSAIEPRERPRGTYVLERFGEEVVEEFMSPE